MDYVQPQYHQILFRLADQGVEFVGVGMVAAILQGVPLTTLDLDIVHRRTPENVNRLLRVLADLDAVARGDPRRVPASISLESQGRRFQFLQLRELLSIKKRAGRPKDLAAIPYIESTIDEIERGNK